MTQADAQTNIWAYYFAGSRGEEVNPVGRSHVMYFNESGKTVQEIDALTNKITFDYDGLRRLIKRTEPEGNATLYEYDARHNLTKTITVPKPGSTNASVVRLSTYEPNFNRLATFVDPLRRTNNNFYDTSGNLVRIDGPTVDGFIPQTLFNNNSRGEVVQITDPSGRRRVYSYHPITGELLASTIDPGGLNLPTQFDYDAVGNLRHTMDPLGRVITIEYDAMRQIKQQIAPSPFNYVTTNGYDAEGRLVEIGRQTGAPMNPWQVTKFSYTLASQKKTDTSPLGNVTTYQYDQCQRLSALIDAENHTNQYKYDTLGRLHQIIDVQGNIRKELLYTANGKQRSIREAQGNLTQYQYDDFDRLSKIVYPDNSFEQFTYDSADNVVQKRTRSGQIITNIYDNLNRLRIKSMPGGTLEYTYDLAGRLVDATNASGNIHHVYDAAGRVASISYPGSNTVSNQYDAVGNRIRITYPGGYFVTYNYDVLNRVTNVLSNGTTPLARYSYDPLSRRTSVVYGNDASAKYAYDSDTHLTSITNQFNGNSVSFAYTFDKVGNRTSLQASDDSFLFRPGSNTQDAYVVNNLNQYSSVNGTPYAYDGNGNLAFDGLNAYTYDAENRLLSVTNASYSVTNTYDALGRRIAKKVNGITTSYLCDRDQVIVEVNGSGQMIRRYVYGMRLDEPISITTTSATYYYHFDGVTSIAALSGSIGSVIEKYTYNTFGRPTTASSVGNPYLYTGREYDQETELYYYRARFYVPRIGRFAQTDPISYLTGEHQYAYVDNNPLNYWDPFGLWGFTIDLGGSFGYWLGFAGDVELVYVSGHGWNVFTAVGGGIVSPGGEGHLYFGPIFNITDPSQYRGNFVTLAGNTPPFGPFPGIGGGIFGWPDGPWGFKLGPVYGTPGASLVWQWYKQWTGVNGPSK